MRTAVLAWGEIDAWWPIVPSALSLVRQRDGVRRVKGERAIDAIVPLLYSRFSHVRLFHGCRPVDVKVYYRDGLRRHGPAILDQARRIFRAQGIPGPSIETAIADTALHIDQGRVFLALDDRSLINHAGHYMIYGSEAVMAVGATLVRQGYPGAQAALMQVGRPTLLTCELPLSSLSDHSVRQLAESIYDEHRLARGRQRSVARRRDHTVVVHADIPGTAVRSHRTPPAIPDWHRGGISYRYKEAAQTGE